MAAKEEQLRVLVVDDLADARLLLSTLYEHAGAQVVSVSSGAEAIEAIKWSQKDQRPFDLISTDIRMPELNGLDLTSQIRSIGFQGSIVAFTATVNLHDKQKGVKNGINKYFSKTSIKREVIEALLDQVRHGTPL